MTDFNFPRPVVKDESDCWFVVSRAGEPRERIMRGPKRPLISVEGESWTGHRLSYHLNVAPIPRCPLGGIRAKSGLVLHSCDVGCCVNPSHLYLGTDSQNRQDMYDRHPTIREQRSRQFKGKVLSQEHKEKIRASKFGNKGPLGRRQTDEHRRKISEAVKLSWKRRRASGCA